MKKYKGEYGYIDYRKKLGIIRTTLFFACVLGLFLTGIFVFGSQKNFLSIIAALLCLPTGWSGVNLIMFLRANSISPGDHSEIESHRGNLLIYYDMVITSYDKNYNLSAATVLDKNICCYMADAEADENDLEKHIRKMMAQGGYSSYSIKIFKKIDDFCARLDQLERLRSEKGIDPKAIEDAWVPGTAQTPASILLSISL